MLSKKKLFESAKEKAKIIANRANHQLKKWHFKAKERTIGVTLNDRLQHKILSLKHQIEKQKQDINTRLDSANKTAEKLLKQTKLSQNGKRTEKNLWYSNDRPE